MKNTNIEFFGTKWKIKYIDKVYMNNEYVYGTTNTDTHEILISTLTSSDKKLPENEIKITLYHELVHAMLLTGQYVGYSDDEPLVEWLARCIKIMVDKQIWLN